MYKSKCYTWIGRKALDLNSWTHYKVILNFYQEYQKKKKVSKGCTVIVIIYGYL